MLGMTLGLLVTGTVVYLIGSHQRSNAEEDARNWKPTVSVLPIVGEREAGLQLRWAF
jgi:hypothetical protein